MVLNDKQKYLKNLIDIINMCEDITKDMDESIRIDLMTSFQQMIIYIGEQLENDQDKRDCKLIKEHNIIEKLENLCEEIYICSQIFSQNTVDIIKKSVSYIIEEINNLPITYRVAFLPYKASMWDSLESIWKAFANDEKCETSVVPIPYYEANSITGQWEYHYDGSIYPEDVPIVDYKNYILSEKKPDFIFFHNPYDDYNYVTKVHPDFFSKNLKKYCRKLVYVPYYANMGYLSKDAKSLPALHRADYLIFQSDAMKEGCLEQPFYERILTFGSPKFDKVLRYMAQKVTEPEEWGIKDVERGKIFIDGKDINDIKVKTIRDNICYITQDNFLFSATLKENINLFKDEYKDEDIEESTKQAMIYDEISSMEEGINTVIGEKGIDLSGGQKQRVVISRAFLNNSNIIIFDDTFSALDNRTEQHVLNNIKELTKNKTCIIVSNRISDIKDCDKIIVLEQGEIVEQGTHQTLLKTNGKYQEFYQNQAHKAQSTLLD